MGQLLGGWFQAYKHPHAGSVTFHGERMVGQLHGVEIEGYKHPRAYSIPLTRVLWRERREGSSLACRGAAKRRNALCVFAGPISGGALACSLAQYLPEPYRTVDPEGVVFVRSF